MLVLCTFNTHPPAYSHSTTIICSPSSLSTLSISSCNQSTWISLGSLARCLGYTLQEPCGLQKRALSACLCILISYNPTAHHITIKDADEIKTINQCSINYFNLSFSLRHNRGHPQVLFIAP